MRIEITTQKHSIGLGLIGGYDKYDRRIAILFIVRLVEIKLKSRDYITDLLLKKTK